MYTIVELSKSERGNRWKGQWAVLKDGEIVYTSKNLSDCFRCIVNNIAFDSSPAYRRPRI